jgi:hypothetical protein
MRRELGHYRIRVVWRNWSRVRLLQIYRCDRFYPFRNWETLREARPSEYCAAGRLHFSDEVSS